MAISDSKKISLLFKTFFGKSEVDINKPYYEEPKVGRPIVFGSQIWSDVDDIPTTAPTLTNAQESGVVKYFEKATLTAIPGITNGYFLADLVDAIPASFGDGSYAPILYKNDGTTNIPNGQNDWVLNEAAGTLYFYGGNPSSVSTSSPPKISFYKYIGTKGGGGGGGGSSVTISDTAPAEPSAGDMWWDSTIGELLIYYSDSTSDQWVSASGSSGGLWFYDTLESQLETDYNVFVNGTLNATTKNFNIKHPLKEDYRLRYGCLEGPENAVYVRGRTNQKQIVLPDYWKGLVHEDTVTVNITPIGNINIWVEKIENNVIYINSLEENIDCFYMILGERSDVEKLIVEYPEINDK